MGWRVRFLPDEAETVTVLVNGEHVLDWGSGEGVVYKDLPAKFVNLKTIDVYCDNYPHGQNALVEFWWDDKYIKHLHFSNGEGHTIDRDDDFTFAVRSALLHLGVRSGDQLLVVRGGQQIPVDLQQFTLK